MGIAEVLVALVALVFYGGLLAVGIFTLVTIYRIGRDTAQIQS